MGVTRDWEKVLGLIAYRGKSKNRLKFLCLSEFQSHNTLRLLLLRVNYIQLQIKSNNFHGLTIKMKRILGLKLGQKQIHMMCAFPSAVVTRFKLVISHSHNFPWIIYIVLRQMHKLYTK